MITGFSKPTGNESIAELCDMIAKLQKQVEFLMNGNLSSKNVREIGGWQIDDDRIVSLDEDVGMSTEDTAGDDVRFWAGGTDPNAAAWRVTKAGKMTATGATIQSSAGYPKIYIDPTSNFLGAFQNATNYLQITPTYAGAPALSITLGGTNATLLQAGLLDAQAMDLTLSTTGSGNVVLSPELGHNIVVPGWDVVLGTGGLSLQDELNLKADATDLAAKSSTTYNDGHYGSNLVYNSTSKLLKLYAPNGTLLATADLT